jgi:YidC/Oxa1 family membrane protein insertase
MDKNSIIGLLLMGAILLGFGLFFGADEEESQKNQTEISSTDSKKMNTDVLDSNVEAEIISPIEDEVVALPNRFVEQHNESGDLVYDTQSGLPIYTDSVTGRDTTFSLEKKEIKEVATESFITLKNNLIELEVSTKGGGITKAYLTEFKKYSDYVDENEKVLQLFDNKSSYGIVYGQNGKMLSTKDLNFTIIKESETLVKMEAKSGKGSVQFTYSLKNDSYDVDYSIAFKGMDDSEASKAMFVADFNLLSTEKHLPTEQRASSIYFDDDGSYDYLGTGDDDDEFDDSKPTWVAFKQSFFTAMIMKSDGFGIGSKIEAKKPVEVDSVYIRDYSADLNLGLENMSNTIDLKWYFGPNDYDILAEHNNGSEDLVDLGWGIFRWINVYALRPMYKNFLGWGMSAGLAILLLTFIVKLILSPVNYKMYKSSAMMKVLKPEIAELTAKFPDKKDSMKKQQALMALYKEAGASPMAGCVPMLIQMPILFAIFRLFPSAIEMRQHRFLWADDLSSYDSIYTFPNGFEIPFYGDHISLFTLLMAGTTLVYTHFNSSNMQQPTQEGMPNMKYIMYFFPIMMIFFFNSYSSGLSFYYFISTLMTMLIMLAIKYFILDEKKIHAKIAANKANPKKSKGKSNFSKRLEEAQKMQAEKQKNRK